MSEVRTVDATFNMGLVSILFCLSEAHLQPSIL